MQSSNRVDCKSIKCKHQATKSSGFCGWCDKKYKKGMLLADGRVTSEVCLAKDCERPSKVKGWCGWCVKRFEKGELTAQGSLSPEAEKARKLKDGRQEKRAKNKEKRNSQELRDELRELLTIEKLKILSLEHEEYRKTFGCPYHQIQIEPASCFGRMFLRPKSKKRTGLGLCQKCDYHDDKLVPLKQRLEKM